MQMISPDKLHRAQKPKLDIKPFLEAEPVDLNFGQIYLGQICSLPIRVRASNYACTSMSSSLYSIVYFKDGKQKLENLMAEPQKDGYVEYDVYFKPDRIGP